MSEKKEAKKFMKAELKQLVKGEFA